MSRLILISALVFIFSNCRANNDSLATKDTILVIDISKYKHPNDIFIVKKNKLDSLTKIVDERNSRPGDEDHYYVGVICKGKEVNRNAYCAPTSFSADFCDFEICKVGKWRSLSTGRVYYRQDIINGSSPLTR